VQHGQRSDAWVVKVSAASLILAKRDKGLRFTFDSVEFQFRCVLGRNIVGKSRILRCNDDYLELAFPATLAIIQRRQAYRVVPTADSIAIFQSASNRILSGRIEDLSTIGMLVRLPQATPITVPSEIKAVCLQLNHAVPAGEFAPAGATERSLVTCKTATIVRKADNGTTRLATYGIHFSPTAVAERKLLQIILLYERAARLKGLAS
jgi:c-di-GMP-binding flagellar brake protein YcgR